MNIGIFIENYRKGGLDRVIIDKINYWKEKNDQFTFFLNEDHEGIDYLKENINKNKKVEFNFYTSPYFTSNTIFKKIFSFVYLRFYNIFWCYIRMIFEISYFKKQFIKSNIEAIFIHNGGVPGNRLCRSAAFAAKLIKINETYIVIHNLAFKKNITILLQEYIVESLIKYYEINIIAVSNAVAETLKKYTYFPQSKIILNGIREIELKEYSKVNYYKDFNIEQDSIIITTIGTFESRRGHEILFKALQNVASHYKNIILLLCGTGTINEIRKIKRMIGYYNISPNVRLLGFRDDVANLINMSDLIINPVIAFESFGLVALEAMALKKIIISSNVGGTSEVIIHKETGILFEAGNFIELSKYILDLLANKDLTNNMANAGYERYIKYFQASRMSENYQDLLS